MCVRVRDNMYVCLLCSCACNIGELGYRDMRNEQIGFGWLVAIRDLLILLIYFVYIISYISYTIYPKEIKLTPIVQTNRQTERQINRREERF